MTDVEDSIAKAQRQIDSLEGTLVALGESLKQAYKHVNEQLSHNPSDPYLIKQDYELNNLIERLSASVSSALLTVGISHITKEEIAQTIMVL